MDPDRVDGSRGRFRFRRKERLKSRDEIGAAFRRGRRVADRGVKLFIMANALPHSRFAVTFARKFGNAVERNRARRVSREAYRHLSGRIKAGFDLVLLVYPGNDTFSVRMRQLEALFSRAGLFVRE